MRSAPFLVAVLLVPTILPAQRIEPPLDGRSVPQLLAALGHELPQHRLAAAKALAAKGPAVLPHLREALAHDHWRVRRGAADALTAMRAAAAPAVPALTMRLADPDAWVREGVAVALGVIGKDAVGAAKRLASLAGDPDVWVREAALDALRKVTEDPEFLLPAALAAMRIRESGWSAKRHAMAILRRHGRRYRPAVPVLLNVLRHSPEGMWDATEAIVQLLQGLGALDQTMPVLIARLRSPHWFTRVKTARTLVGLGPAAAPALAALREVAEKDEVDRVRTAVRKSITELEEKIQGRRK